MKFAPDGSTLAVGAHDSLIFVYDVASKFKSFKKLKGNTSTIRHIDYTENSGSIQSVSGSYELLYFDIGSGTQMKSGATALRDEKWASWTCILGWSVQGIWPPCSDGSDINSVDRSVDCSVLATADDFGKVKLFKYPCPIESKSRCNKPGVESCFQVYRGHSSHVTKVRFTADGNYLISTGGHDKSIFQWKYVNDSVAKEEAETITEDKDLAIDEVRELSEEERKKQERELAQKKKAEEEGLFETEEVGEDKFMAVKPFLGEVINSTPNDYKPTPDAGKIPDANLSIRYVHGYRSFDTRNNVKWTKKGLVLYHTAALGIVLDPNNNTQTYFNRHQEDIGSIAATGQMAQAGRAKMIEIYVWDIETKDVLACLKGFHLRAIRHLRFSPNGVYLLSIGEDDNHSLAIYDWVNNRLIATSKVDGSPVTTCEFKSDTEFITCGVKHVKFWSLNGLNLTGTRGLMGNGNFEPQLCAAFAFAGKTCVTGSSKGNLVIWAGRSAGKRLPAHKGQVWAIMAKGNGLISGGQDGMLVIWDQNFKQVSTIDLSKHTRMDPGIRALDLSKDGAYLIGTRGAEIIRIHNQKRSTLMHGHSAGELWGLCVSPSGAQFASCGGDKTLRVWGIDKLALTMKMSEDGRAVDWSANGNFIVFGSVNGVIYCFSAKEDQNLKTMSTLQSSFGKEQWLEDIKISPNSQMVAFGSHRGVSKIEVMKVGEQGEGLAKFCIINAGLTSALTHLDWDVTSANLVVNSQAYELKFLDVNAKRSIASSGCKNVDWYTWSCVLGFPVQGIFPPCSDGTDVNSTSRSNSKKVLATGDDFSTVKLFRYPCTIKHASYKEYRGHSSHVTKVKFSFDDRYLVSTGGNDKTVIVWSTDMGAEETKAAEPEPEPVAKTEEEQKEATEEAAAYDETDMQDIEKKIKELQEEMMKKKAKQAAKAKAEAEGGDFVEEEAEKATEFMATKPWKGALREPTGFVKPPFNQSQAPKIGLALEYVHGYRSRDCKNNIAYLDEDRIVYHAAAVGIVMDKASNTQSFFNLHTDDILSIAFHPDKILVATGQLGPKPPIYVWNTTTCQVVCKFQGKLQKGIKSLAFSPSGTYLAGVDMDTYHMLAIYDVNAGALVTVCKTDPSLVLQVVFKTETELVTVGVKHYMYWQFNHQNLTSKRGIFKTHNNVLGCVAANAETILTGNVLGELYQWSANSITLSKKVHAKTLDCITLFDDMYVHSVTLNRILTGGRDAKINFLNKSLSSIMTIDVSGKNFASISPLVRNITVSADKKHLVVGTFGSEIYEVAIDEASKAVKDIKLLMQGHYSPCRKNTNEIWGLAALPAGEKFVSASDDATLRLWDTVTRKQEKLLRFDVDGKGQALPKDPTTQELAECTKARSVAVSPDGKFAAVGFKDGTLRIIDIENWAVISKHNDCKAWISDIKFSPDGTKLIIGSHDMKMLMVVYEFPKMIRRAVMKGHSSHVRHIDWSVDSHTLHSNSGDYELLFWNADTGEQIKSGATAFRDEKWASWTCIIGWPVQEIWLPCSKGTDINGCDRSNAVHDTYNLLATADDFSTIRVLRYPCINKGAAAIEGKGHSSHVTSVRFAPDDKYLFSIGGNDGCVFQWKING